MYRPASVTVRTTPTFTVAGARGAACGATRAVGAWATRADPGEASPFWGAAGRGALQHTSQGRGATPCKNRRRLGRIIAAPHIRQRGLVRYPRGRGCALLFWNDWNIASS